MIVGINGFEAVIPRFGYDKNGSPRRVGSSEVCYELLVEFSKIDDKNEYVIYLPSEPTPDMPKENDRWHYKIVKGDKLWTIFGLTRELLKRPKLDVFFSPTHYGPLFTPCPEVICLLDVSYKYFPELFNKKDLIQLALWGKYSIKRAARIVTISDSSKSDIIKEYGLSNDKISVFHLGVKESLKPSMSYEKLSEKYSIKKPYVLFVGTIQPRKNIARLIEAFSQIEDREVNLVIVGRKGWMYDEVLEAPQKFNLSDRVTFLHDVTDGELPVFYENAELFVLPSLYEGFGLPILEAMKYGCPVVTSNVSSLPEAGGNAAVFFDPYDVSDIAKKMEKVLKDKTLRDKMKKEGHSQVKKFSWEKAASEVLGVFEEIGGQKNGA